MNTTERQHTDPRHDPQRIVPTPADEALSVPREHRAPAVEASTTPEAVCAAQVAHAEKQHAAVVRGRGVEWVRPADLMARHSASVAGRGLDFQAELARRSVTTSTPTQPGVGIG